jgi:hypothetical protein
MQRVVTNRTEQLHATECSFRFASFAPADAQR